ncbi:MAG TPA: hypothetical protein DDW50_15795 [Firmicutes bacterium]|jgi:hypothetical protein|nr:hypothetical protein [Bacillota bacterium]
MVKSETLKKIFEKYWSLFGFVLAMASISWIIIHRDTFMRNHFWMLWAFIPMLMLHNFEESFFPGNFLPWFNRTCFQSDQDFFPSGRTPSAIFSIINCWILTFIAATIANHFIYLAVVMIFFFIQNAWMHISYTLSSKYSPGAITSFVLLAPFGGYILYTLIATGKINIVTLIICYLVGSLLHYNMFFMIRKLQKK